MKVRAWKGELILRIAAYIVVGLIVLGCKLFSQNWIEERTYISRGVATPRIDGLFTKPLNKKWGSFAWFQVQQSYSQAYAGPTYSPTPWMQLAIGAGLEQDKDPARIGSYIWMGKGKSSGLGVFEGGGSGFWYKVETNYQAEPKFGVGILSERYRGSGPKFEFMVPHTPIKLWLAPLYLNGSIRPLIGLRWNM